MYIVCNKESQEASAGLSCGDLFLGRAGGYQRGWFFELVCAGSFIQITSDLAVL
jgi:hypothetical protein